jgi:hypothetical protein
MRGSKHFGSLCIGRRRSQQFHQLKTLFDQIANGPEDGFLLLLSEGRCDLFHGIKYLVEMHRQAPPQLAPTLGIARAEAEDQVRAAEYLGGAPWQAPAPEDHRTAAKGI